MVQLRGFIRLVEEEAVLECLYLYGTIPMRLSGAQLVYKRRGNCVQQ